MIPNWLNPIAAGKARYKVPFTKVSMSVGTTIVALIVMFVLVVISFAATSQPIFCASCHEMDTHFKTWQVSSHRNVPCEECHVSPGLWSMFKSKIDASRLVAVHVAGPPKEDVIRGHVPDINCKRCHPTTPQWVVYHGLKISHRKHWDRGIHCTVCHRSVVHGPNAATINVPTMETCFQCHNGKQAPNRCGLCHETLGVRKPATFSADWVTGHKAEVAGGREKCMRCHQPDFCSDCHRMANPHGPGFMDVHGQEYKRNPKSCDMCHPENLRKYTCDACHGRLRTHPLDWVTTHPAVVKKGGDTSCRKCHQVPGFCTDCHTRYKPHPPNWIEIHPAQAKQRLARCQVCHTTQFCQACHTNEQPPSHKAPGWIHDHKSVVLAGNTSCSTCHTQSFCMACHQRTPPESHKVDWRNRHGLSSMSGNASCSFCHEKKFCDSCHGIAMPHPDNWRNTHPSTARTNRALCARCHQPQFCTSCHQGAKPLSHNAPNWAPVQHSIVAKKDPSYCTTCHTKDFCQTCHSLAKPNWHRAPGFMTGGHGKLAEKDRQRCSFCHTSPSFCANCHQHSKPASHTETWLATHGKVAASSKFNCSYCHNRSLCDNCHNPGGGGIKPSSHNDQWIMGHGKVAARNLNYCAMCHTADLCNNCHKAMKGPRISL